MFNVEEHIEKLRIINYGRTKWPEEKNITKLYQMACKDMGIEIKTFSTSTASHLPTPEESARENPNSKFVQVCPKCGKKSYFLRGLCKGCKDAENGKYKTMFKCYECQYEEKSEEPMVVWLDRLGIEFHNQSKKSLGIETVTDEGIK